MNNPKDLPNVTERVLYGLTADDSLKHRILQQAAQQKDKKVNKPFYLIPVFCTALAVLVLTVVVLNRVQPVSPSVPGEINVFTAGNDISSLPEKDVLCPLDPDISENNILSIQIAGLGTVLDSQQCAMLFCLLRDESIPADSPDVAVQNEMVITLKNGTEIRFNADEPYFYSGSDCWSCAAFFESARQMLTE